MHAPCRRRSVRMEGLSSTTDEIKRQTLYIDEQAMTGSGEYAVIHSVLDSYNIQPTVNLGSWLTSRPGNV
ncbi:hypothetical protein MLD38_033105 [Melastoma candidum]|uniref:Uncharacterized protein n=1 Tax=Melastoma candidum TaxID=119954 RepID=A0ACB9M6A1_9MYRT|nr:hypothetical protein MLD38_033105 [Melastoma candidum]